MRFAKAAISLGMCMGLGLAGVAVAPAGAAADLTESQVTAVNSDDTAALRAFLTKYDVRPDVQASLLAKLDAGQLWDSLSGTPVSTETWSEGDTLVTKDTYLDGSIAVATVPNTELIAQTSQANRTPRSVYNCVYSSGGAYAGYWKNCTADENRGLLRFGFTIDYQKVSGRGAKITGYRNGYHECYGGSVSALAFSRQSSSAVRYGGTFTMFGGYSSASIWVQANVDMNHAWTTDN